VQEKGLLQQGQHTTTKKMCKPHVHIRMCKIFHINGLQDLHPGTAVPVVEWTAGQGWLEDQTSTKMAALAGN